MNKQLPQTLKGFRDFLPNEKKKRDFVMQKIKEVFETFGFEPLETPTLEYTDLLLGKYGDEADKLVYTFKDRGNRDIGLRYDQTVPTARVLAQYQNELPTYFRRYQMQNVFRADKPQKGRFREFTQCDIDIFGSTSPLADAEIIACTYFAYKNIGFKKINLKINDRQTLFATFKDFANEKLDVFSIIQSIDKLDKLSLTKVIEELINKGLEQKNAEQVLEATQSSTPSKNLQKIMKMAQNLGVPKNALIFEPSLARGLDYYTGMIFEVILPDYKVGSVGGGGRYDSLIKELSDIDIPAVGMAVGFDRTVEAADELGLLPKELKNTQVLITLFDESTITNSLNVAQKLREANIPTEVFPAFEKLGKQFTYANQKDIPFVVIIGEDEIKQNKVSVKNMKTGEQKMVDVENVTFDM